MEERLCRFANFIRWANKVGIEGNAPYIVVRGCRKRKGVVMRTTSTIHFNKGEISRKHNERDEKLCENENHIDLYNEQGNSYAESWLSNDLREKYIQIFGDSLEEYNMKQKRKCRQMTIDDYMKSIRDDTRGKRQTKKVKNDDGTTKRVALSDDELRRKPGKQLSYEFTVKLGNAKAKKKGWQSSL